MEYIYLHHPVVVADKKDHHAVLVQVEVGDITICTIVAGAYSIQFNI